MSETPFFRARAILDLKQKRCCCRNYADKLISNYYYKNRIIYTVPMN